MQGLVAGTPFYLALIPGYMNYLWQEARMTLRLATLYGRDPGILTTAAELLSLRGVYPDADAAEAGLIAVEGMGMPAKPENAGRSDCGSSAAAGCSSSAGSSGPPSGESHRRFALVVARRSRVGAFIALWAITWIFPVTFMIMMAWGCETHSRQLFQRVRSFYASSEAAR